MGNRRWLAVALVFGLAMLIGAGLSAIRAPVPRVHDEFCNLLAADTFAEGRLSMPTHPMWVHFETFHVLKHPTYASKYPPVPALLLALGQLLTAAPIVGAWLGVALGAGAVCWMLQGWTRPRWAFLGGLIVAAHPGIHGGIDASGRDYSWSQGFWGGGVGLAGGALVLGAVVRLSNRPRRFDSIALGLGIAILAGTRPFEGLIVSALALLLLLTRLARTPALRTGRTIRIVFGPMAVIVALAAIALGVQHQAITGSVWRMPYSVYESSYDPIPVFTLFARPTAPPAYRHVALDRFFNGWCHSLWERQQTLDGWWAFHRERLGWLWAFLVGALVPPVALIPLVVWKGGWKAGFSALLFAACVGVHGLTMGLHPHYVAPALPAFVYLMVEGFRRLALLRVGTLRAGRVLVLLTLLMMVVKLGMVARARLLAPEGWEETRARIGRALESDGGRHLVIVRYGDDHDVHAEWVYNRARIDAATVVWAREMDPESMRRLRDYFRDRTAWLVEPDAPRVEPHPYVAPPR